MIVAISVDQLSANLFSEYRSSFTGGLKRLANGAVFPSGYQSHAATETCPGHSTIMTGVHSGRAGIIANNWIDLSIKREDKTVYCAEDERIEGTSFGDITAAMQGDYIASAWHLLVPTLGERLKKISPESRNVAVAGKDRAALMMGGKNVDEIYWWKGKGFSTLQGRKTLPSVAALNEAIGAKIDKARPAYEIPAQCVARNARIMHGDGKSVGDYAFQRPDGAASIYRGSPDFDGSVIDAATALVEEMKLGQLDTTDILSVGLSATDYIGHAFGTEGLEMCIQMSEVDRSLGEFFDILDSKGIDYAVMLTSDHGGLDLPERMSLQGVPAAQRVDPKLNAKTIGEIVAKDLAIAGDKPVLYADSPFGDYYVSLELAEPQRQRVKDAAMALIGAHAQVEVVLDRDDIMDISVPSGSPEEWTLVQRARASFHPDRSGDFIVLLKKAVTPIATTARGYVATHGSPWDYDRRVPILFWREGIRQFEQPLSVMTVDIAPTLGALIGVDIPADETDGTCLDIDGGPGNSCD
ncbi:MAG: alkaline phosphatase family protein [Sphingomonadales bacterium]|nr:alkaline phosphatase family protein [Sphingomonadales bacterium]PIX67023.1 MAG: alkaline phosphatase [Sphingomonadales bacterium CG_4_10_14_3_um_filter_58_15]NCO49466.1 alkaline phosphatase family protein [Sphingomonadales bacterium]NCP01311.1 alkaline phosphatase family protein [Sphingomonadales bacterium]NCP26633.1 alkaline phosphatase family protein [Sphingomonadales bacterium]